MFTVAQLDRISMAKKRLEEAALELEDACLTANISRPYYSTISSRDRHMFNVDNKISSLSVSVTIHI